MMGTLDVLSTRAPFSLVLLHYPMRHQPLDMLRLHTRQQDIERLERRYSSPLIVDEVTPLKSFVSMPKACSSVR